MKRMKKNNSASLKWLAAKSRGQRFNLALLIFSNAFFSVLSVAFAFAVKAIINGATDGKKQELIYGAAAIVAIVLLQFVFRIVINGLAEHIRGKLEIAYKSHIFSEILNKKYDKINTYHSGELLNRLSVMPWKKIRLCQARLTMTIFWKSLTAYPKQRRNR